MPLKLSFESCFFPKVSFTVCFFTVNSNKLQLSLSSKTMKRNSVMIMLDPLRSISAALSGLVNFAFSRPHGFQRRLISRMTTGNRAYRPVL